MISDISFIDVDEQQHLAQLIASGNQQAEAQLFSHLQIIERVGMMIRRRFVIPAEDREDLEVEISLAFLLYLRAGKFDCVKGCLLSCLWGIALNKTRDYWKRRRYDRSTELCEEVLTCQAQSHLEQHEQRESIKRKLRKLDVKYQAVLIMRYYEGIPVADIADFLEIEVSQVYNRIHYALKLLTNLL